MSLRRPDPAFGGQHILVMLEVRDRFPSTQARFFVKLATLTGLLLVIALASPTKANPEAAAPIPARGVVVYVQPLGDGLSAADIDATVQALTVELGAVVRVLASRPLPQTAYYPERDRYRAEKLLDSLESLLPPDGDRILGVTARDISTTRGTKADWGMVGLASYTHPVGVVSKFRCLRGGTESTQTRERLAKIAVHEVGHSLGLEHCLAAECVMQDAHGKVTICEEMDGFCPRCRALMQASGWLLPSNPIAPWSVRQPD
jgi:archaemetzincin